MSKKPTMEPLPFATKKHADVAQISDVPATKGLKDDKRVGMTLRLKPDAWRQLKVLAMDKRTSVHPLLIIAINALFKQHGLPPIAE